MVRKIDTHNWHYCMAYSCFAPLASAVLISARVDAQDVNKGDDEGGGLDELYPRLGTNQVEAWGGIPVTLAPSSRCRSTLGGGSRLSSR